jgi:broad specificity phosphatase PhoE
MLPDASENWPPPARRRVYLMRHAEVDYFDREGRPQHPDHVPLNEAGELQARAAGEALAEVTFDRVICSGLLRTEQTARLVLGERVVPIEVEARLREIEPGRFADIASAPRELVRQAILGTLGEHITAGSSFLGGETFGACAERVRAVWRGLVEDAGWRVLLVVAHGVVNRLLLAHVLGMPLSAVGRVEQDAGCINLIDVGEGGAPLVRLVNATALNPGKVGMKLSTLEGLYQQYLRGR